MADHDDMRFQYYGDEDVMRIVPSHGPVSGGTLLTISGSNFLDTLELSCRFGSTADSPVVPALYNHRVSGVLRRVPRDLACAHQVSNNGRDYISIRDISFEYGGVSRPFYCSTIGAGIWWDDNNLRRTLYGDDILPLR